MNIKKLSVFAAAVSAAVMIQAAERNPWTHLNFDNDPEDFRFAIVPDRSGGDFRGAFTNALKCVNMMRPEFVMTVGDLVQGVTTPDRLTKQQIELTNFTSKVKAPFFYVVGNHDITRSRAVYPLHHEDSSKVWREFYGDKTYYSFKYKRCLFMIVDTMSGRDSRKNQCAITPEQYDWINNTLADNADVRWTFGIRPIGSDSKMAHLQTASTRSLRATGTPMCMQSATDATITRFPLPEDAVPAISARPTSLWA